jgi:hypothetical protein
MRENEDMLNMEQWPSSPELIANGQDISVPLIIMSGIVPNNVFSKLRNKTAFVLLANDLYSPRDSPFTSELAKEFVLRSAFLNKL